MYNWEFQLYNCGVLRIGVSEARSRLSELVDKTHEEAVLLERRGEPAAVMVSPERYEELLAAFEELDDIAALDAATTSGDSKVPWEQVRADLGW